MFGGNSGTRARSKPRQRATSTFGCSRPASAPPCTTVLSAMPSRVLVHYPEPAPPKVEPLPDGERPAIGAEFLPGWKACDYNLARGEWDGEEYRYEVWVMPISGDCC